MSDESIHFGKSLINTENNWGPATAPYTTLEMTDIGLD